MELVNTAIFMSDKEGRLYRRQVKSVCVHFYSPGEVCLCPFL